MYAVTILALLVAYVCYRLHGRPAEHAVLVRRKASIARAMEHVARMHKIATEIAEYRQDVSTPFMLAYYNLTAMRVHNALDEYNAAARRFNHPIRWLLSRPIR